MGEDVVFLVRQLCKVYGDHTLLHDATLSVKRAEILGIVAPRATGKTTLFYLLAGLVKPTSGDVLFHAYTPKGVIECEVTTHQSLILRSVGFAYGNPAIDKHFTAREHLEYVARLHNMSNDAMQRNIDVLLRLFELRAFEHLLLAKCPQTIHNRVELASALVHSPAVLFIDDLQHQDLWIAQHLREVLSRLQGRGITTIVAAREPHHLTNLCDRVMVLHDATLTPLQVQHRTQRLLIVCDPSMYDHLIQTLVAAGNNAKKESRGIVVHTKHQASTLRLVISELEQQGYPLIECRTLPVIIPPLRKDHSLVTKVVVNRTLTARSPDAPKKQAIPHEVAE